MTGLYMNTKKIAALLWTVGSLAFFITILAYVLIYQPVSGSNAGKVNQLINHWVLVTSVWKAETLSAIFLAVSAWFFSITEKSIAWFLVSVAHIIIIVMYALLLGAYPSAVNLYSDHPFLFPMVNETAVWIFSLSNLLFLTGLSGIYYKNLTLNKWISKTGMIISIIGSLGALALFFGLITFSQMNILGPLILLLYLINAYLGFKLIRN